LFLLSHASPFNPEDLRALARRQQRIEVAYTEPADLVAAVAHRIALLEPASDGKIPHGWADTIRGFLADWSLPRQLKGESARSAAAESAESAHLRPRLSEADKVGTNICCYCAVGCAQLVYAKDGKVIHIEGDPRSPINQGTLCPKGAATLDLLTTPLRLNTVLYRAPGGDRWEEKPRSEEHTSELQSQSNLVCRLLLEKKKSCCRGYGATHVLCPPSS